MESHFSLFITLGLFLILLLLLFRTYWMYRKKVAGFPFYNLLPYVAYCQVTGKISKDTPINHVLFEQLVKLGKRHLNEGIFMTYVYQPTLMIFSKEAIQVFANEKAALDKSPEYKIADKLMGNGITNSNGEKWRRHRKLINPVFNMAVLKDKVSIFNEHAEALVKDMGKLANEGDAVNIDDVLKFHYLNNLSESVLGLKQGEETKAQMVKIFGYVDNLTAMLVQQFLYPWLRPLFLLHFFPSGRRFLQEYKEIEKFINDTLLNMKKHVSSNENDDVSSFGHHLRKSFTYILLKHHSNNPEVFTFEHLRDETKTMMVAGYDTVTFATMWCLYSLGSHPEIQEKVYNEILSTTSDYITYEECSNLTYLEAAIMETLRLYPSVPIFSRNLSEDVQFGKYKVLKGTGIAFFAYLAHRDPRVYPDPEKFEPERFLNSEAQKNWSYIPFSEGSRSCIGKNYALIEMKIFLAHLLRNFKFTSLDRQEDIKLCWTIALTPTKHLRFKITKR